MIQALIRARVIQRAEFLYIGADLNKIEKVEQFILNGYSATVQRHFNVGMPLTYLARHFPKRFRIFPFAKKQDTVHAEIVGNQPVYNLRGKFFADVLTEKR